MTCTAAYTVTQADIDHGKVSDSATVRGIPPATRANPSPPQLPPSPASAVSVPAAQHPAIRVVKTATPAQARPGGQVRYRFTVTNTGNVTLHKITVSDPMLGARGITVRCPHRGLAPGASEDCTASRPYVVTGADAARGRVANTADASAKTPAGHVVRSRPSSVRVRVIPKILIPTGEGAAAQPAGGSPALATVGGAALAAGTALLLLMLTGGRIRRRVSPLPLPTALMSWPADKCWPCSPGPWSLRRLEAKQLVHVGRDDPLDDGGLKRWHVVDPGQRLG
jgi:hypothetical protein